MTQDVEKYRELYSLSKEIYNTTLDRFYKVDEKASRYLTCLTFVIGIFGLFGKWIITEALPPSSLVEWLVIANSLATLISFILSWFFLFRVVSVYKLTELPLSDETISLFKEQNLPTVYFTMMKGLRDANMMNMSTVDEKVNWLDRSYRSMIVSGILLLLLMATLAIHSWSLNEAQM